MTLDEQLEILQAAKRGEAEYNYPSWPTWEKCDANHVFNFILYRYRISDPYAELKAAAKDPTKEIRCIAIAAANNEWQGAGVDWRWNYPPESYEIRNKPKPEKVVKYRCWFSTFDEQLHWLLHDPKGIGWYRRPAFDKECEVEDE